MMIETTVRSFADWEAALQVSYLDDVRIRLSTTLNNPPACIIGRQGGTVELLGGEINWAEYKATAGQMRNGITFRGSHTLVRGPRLRNYNGYGCGLRFDSTETIDVDRCTFENIGGEVLPPDASGKGYTNAIGAFKATASRITISGNTFTRCALNDSQLAHVLYIQASQSVLCYGNTYNQCGSIWGCWSPATVITRERVDAGEKPLVWNRTTKALEHPFLLVNNRGNDLTFVNNHVRGVVDHVYHGDKPIGAIGMNDFADCQSKYAFFQWKSGKPERSWDEWRDMGFDK